MRIGEFHPCLRGSVRCLKIRDFAVQDSLNSALQVFHTEIQEKPQLSVGQDEVRLELLRMNWCVCLGGFQFYNNLIVNKHINPKRILNLHPLVFERNRNLVFNLMPSALQLGNKYKFIDRLQQTGA